MHHNPQILHKTRSESEQDPDGARVERFYLRPNKYPHVEVKTPDKGDPAIRVIGLPDAGMTPTFANDLRKALGRACKSIPDNPFYIT